MADQVLAEGSTIRSATDAGLEASISWPSKIEYHAIEDREFEMIIKVQRPIHAIVALTALGIFGGVIAETVDAVEVLNATHRGNEDR